MLGDPAREAGKAKEAAYANVDETGDDTPLSCVDGISLPAVLAHFVRMFLVVGEAGRYYTRSGDHEM